MSKRSRTVSQQPPVAPEDALMCALATTESASEDTIQLNQQTIREPDPVDASRNPVVAAAIRTFIHLRKTRGFHMDETVRTVAPSGLAVPTLSNELVAELLHEPMMRITRSGSRVTAPTCCRGDLCLGRSREIPGLRQGSVRPLSAWMSQHEWNNMLAHGMVPLDPRRCVLCESYTVLYNYNRARLIAPDWETAGIGQYAAHDMQAFCVRMDEEGGYKSQYCIPFSKDGCMIATAGIISPIFLPQLSLLESKYTATGVRYICQKKLWFRNDVEHAGTSERYF